MAQLGTRMWTRQLNAAGKLVAEQEGLFVIDLEHMTSHLSPHLYLRDKHHPRTPVLLELYNLVLNVWRWNAAAVMKGRTTR